MYCSTLCTIFHNAGVPAINSCIIADRLSVYTHKHDHIHFENSLPCMREYGMLVRMCFELARFMNPGTWEEEPERAVAHTRCA
jgi:hypothetical protein